MNEHIKNVIYLPLALPYVQCDAEKIKKFIDKRGTRVDYPWAADIGQPWNHVVVKSPLIPETAGEIPGSGWRPDFKKIFPEVVAAVESLPFTSMVCVYLLEQIIDVKPHTDYMGKNSIDHLEPASYRISLLNEDYETFYMCNDVECTTYQHPTYPEDTNTWVFSNRSKPHGSITPSQGKRKIILIIGGGILDETRHLKLLEESYKKYSDYVIK